MNPSDKIIASIEFNKATLSEVLNTINELNNEREPKRAYYDDTLMADLKLAYDIAKHICELNTALDNLERLGQ